MDGFGMVLIALRPYLRHPVPPEVRGDKPQDFKAFDLEALKQPEEVRARCSQPTLFRYGAASSEWTRTNANRNRRTADEPAVAKAWRAGYGCTRMVTGERRSLLKPNGGATYPT
jgi:hypothetical protein